MINAYIKGEVKPQVNNLTLRLKELEKEEKSNLKFGRRKEIVKIRAEINQIENRKTIENRNKTKSVFFGKINLKDS